MLQALLTGMSLGLFAAVQPGVFQAFLLGETMRHGLVATLPLLIAPVLTDGPIAAVTLLVLSQTPPWLLTSLELAGGMFVLWLALDAARSVRHASEAPTGAGDAVVPSDAGEDMSVLAAGGGVPPNASLGRRLVRAALVNGLNPGPWLFWAIVLGPIAVDAWRNGPWLGAAVVGSFYATLLAGFLGMVALFGVAARRGRRVRRGLQIVSAVALAAFGVLLIGHGVGELV